MGLTQPLMPVISGGTETVGAKGATFVIVKIFDDQRLGPEAAARRMVCPPSQVCDRL